jgi:catechol 2,3-dioxygenase-like lactoylglutathione lyase family enzyme
MTTPDDGPSGGGEQRRPLFVDTLQIGIVVRDLDAALRTYHDEYGIGPWQVLEMNPSNVADMTKDEQPHQHAMRLALAMVGSVQWELIEPLDDTSIYADFLRQHGEGLHHVGVAVESYDEAVDALHGKGHILLAGGRLAGARYAYPSTDRDLKVITEIFDFPEDFEPAMDYVYPEPA